MNKKHKKPRESLDYSFATIDLNQNEKYSIKQLIKKFNLKDTNDLNKVKISYFRDDPEYTTVTIHIED